MARWQNGKMAKYGCNNLCFSVLCIINHFATVWQNVFFHWFKAVFTFGIFLSEGSNGTLRTERFVKKMWFMWLCRFVIVVFSVVSYFKKKKKRKMILLFPVMERRLSRFYEKILPVALAKGGDFFINPVGAWPLQAFKWNNYLCNVILLCGKILFCGWEKYW